MVTGEKFLGGIKAVEVWKQEGPERFSFPGHKVPEFSAIGRVKKAFRSFFKRFGFRVTDELTPATLKGLLNNS